MNAILRRNDRRVPWDVFNDFDNVVTSFFNPVRENANGRRELSVPAIDLIETETAYVVKADLPGVSKDNINVTLEQGVLTIKGEQASEDVKTDEANQNRFIRKERRYAGFARSLRIGDGVNEDAIKAEFVDGVLTLTLPKVERAQPRQIEVRAA